MSINKEKLKEAGLKYIIERYIPFLIPYEKVIIDYLVYDKSPALTQVLDMLNLAHLPYQIKMDYKETYGKDITDDELTKVLKSLGIETALKDNTLNMLSNIVDEIIIQQISEGITGGFSYALNYIQQEKIEALSELLKNLMTEKDTYFYSKDLDIFVNTLLNFRIFLFDTINNKVNILPQLRIDFSLLDYFANKKKYGYMILQKDTWNRMYKIFIEAKKLKLTYDNKNSIFNDLGFNTGIAINIKDFYNRYKIQENLIVNSSKAVLRQSYKTKTNLTDIQKANIQKGYENPVLVNFHYDRNKGYPYGIFKGGIGIPFLNPFLNIPFLVSAEALVSKPYYWWISSLDIININSSDTISSFNVNLKEQYKLVRTSSSGLSIPYNDNIKPFIKELYQIDIKIFTDLLINYSNKETEEQLKDKNTFLELFSDQNILEKLILFFKENPFLSFIIILILLYFLLKES